MNYRRAAAADALIVPFAAGGPTDVISRIVAEHMSRTLGQPIIIENIVGAGGTTASTRAMRAAPDGYTIEMGHVGTHAASVALYPNLAYKPDVDFAPIGQVAGTPVLILARKDFPPKDLKEFTTYVKANADKLTDALDDEQTRKRLLDLGSVLPDKAARGQQALAALVKSEIARWTPIIKAAGPAN
jgi:tripartite-type tricarboxylate transporter receptor subunit TctC